MAIKKKAQNARSKTAAVNAFSKNRSGSGSESGDTHANDRKRESLLGGFANRSVSDEDNKSSNVRNAQSTTSGG